MEMRYAALQNVVWKTRYWSFTYNYREINKLVEYLNINKKNFHYLDMVDMKIN